MLRKVWRFSLSLAVGLVCGFGAHLAALNYFARGIESIGGPNVFREEAGAGVAIFADDMVFAVPLGFVALAAGWGITMLLTRQQTLRNDQNAHIALDLRADERAP